MTAQDIIAEKIVTCLYCLARSDCPVMSGWIYQPNGLWLCARCARDTLEVDQ